MPADLRRVQELFVVALGLADAPARQEFLDRQCGADADLRRRLAAMLRAHDDAGAALSRPRADAPPEDPVSPGVETGSYHESAPNQETVIAGRYKLLEQLGEGGMGTVWVAEQTEPVRRKVAIKLIKAGMDSKTVLSRFDAERQALALMDHPNIAKVLDGGTTEAGRPFFVMEYVKGVPFTQYCDDARLSIAQRLALFVPVCQAVQHAHQKGIIHRDLKPSNILVCLYDGRPVPKVIEFGLAKAMHQPLTEHTLHTAHGLMMGTPLYMSPEQAGLNNLDVDTRTDIYALGVILYELLTGTTPLEKQRFKEAAWQEMLRLIKEEEPPKPSTRLSGAVTLPSVAAQRGLEPVKLARLVRGELDWIVMKCLEKERSRRYDTANGLARDLERYLADEAVEACPPSARYRIGKFARKNRTALTTAAALALLLVAGAGVSTWQALRATRAEASAHLAEKEAAADRDKAVKAESAAKEQRDQAVKAEKKAVIEKSRADQEAAVAKAVNDFLRNDMLAEAAPDKNARVKKVTVEEVLGRAAARIAGKFASQPRIEAAIRKTIGETYYQLGDYAAAQPHLERAVEVNRRALGVEHSDTLDSMNDLGMLYKAQGQYAKAEPLYVKTLEIRGRVLGEEHPDTLTSIGNLAALYDTQGHYAKAEPLYVKALEVSRRVRGEEHPETLTFINNLGLFYHDQGLYAKAEPLYVKSLEFSRRIQGEEHPETLISMNNLGSLYHDQGHLDKAEPLYVKAMEVRRHVLGEEHPGTLISMNNLAGLYQDQGHFGKAEPLYVKTLEVSRRILGEEHSSTLSFMNKLGQFYFAQGQYAKAEPLYVKTLEIRGRVLGEEHPDTLASSNNLGLLYCAQGLYTKAEPLYVKTLEVCHRVLGREHPDTLISMNNLAGLYKAQGLYAKAEPLYVKRLEISRRVLGEEHPDTLTSMNNLAEFYWGCRKLDLAIPLFETALNLRKAKLGPDHPKTLMTKANLGGAYRDADRLKDAVSLLEDADRRIQALPPANQHSLTWVRGALVDAYERAGQLDKGETLLREQMELVKQSAGPDSPSYAGTLEQWGQNLLRQKKWAEAEPVLRECLAIREKKEADAWTTFNTKSALGGALLGQKKYADAEPPLLAGYEGMKERAAKIPPISKFHLMEGLERLVRLYEAMGNPKKAAEWRKKLAVEKGDPTGR